MKKETISIVVACFNEEEALPLFYEEIKKVKKELKKIEIELILVNDGSKDKTLEVIKGLYKKDKKIRYISLSRNFGKEAAMLAGLETASGEYVAVMDADLQDPPELIPKMYLILKKDKNIDTVATRRVTRVGEPKIRSFFARKFYKLINKISNIELVDGARDYRLMRRNVVSAILSLKEYNRFSKGLFGFVGFNTKWLEYENKERIAGETSWSFFSLFKYAIEGIVAFSTAPLTISALIGILFCMIAFVMIIIIMMETFLVGDPTNGGLSIICLLFFVSGIQLFCLGIIGEYLSKTYLETKKRPVYIIKETEKGEV